MIPVLDTLYAGYAVAPTVTEHAQGVRMPQPPD
jgi:hypothetical protein